MAIEIKLDAPPAEHLERLLAWARSETGQEAIKKAMLESFKRNTITFSGRRYVARKPKRPSGPLIWSD